MTGKADADTLGWLGTGRMGAEIRDFEPAFTAKLPRKDFDLGMAAAREREVPMPAAATVRQIIQGLVGRGYGDVDFAAFIAQQAESAGITLESEHAEVSDGLDSDVS